MPVQINEVVISAVVANEESGHPPSSDTPSQNQVSVPDAAIVTEIIEEFLKEKKER